MMSVLLESTHVGWEALLGIAAAVALPFVISVASHAANVALTLREGKERKGKLLQIPSLVLKKTVSEI